MRQYTMVRTNGNDGFIFAGATPYSTTTGKFVYHVFRKHDNGTIIWNYYFYHDLNTDHQITHVDKNVDANGYVFSGYTNFLNSNTMETKPVLFELDENGAMQQEMSLDIQGSLIKIKPTPKGDYIAVGYRAPSVDLETNNRMGIVLKLDASFNVLWYWLSQSNDAFFTASYIQRWDTYQAIDIHLNSNNDEFYYIGGAVSALDPNKPPPISSEHYTPTPHIVILDENGALFCENTFKASQTMPLDGWFTDLKIDTDNNKVWIAHQQKSYSSTTGTTGYSNLFSIELGTCNNIIDFVLLEGNVTANNQNNNPNSGHIFFISNIQQTSTHVWLFCNYTKEFFSAQNMICQSNYTFIPLIIKLDKSNLTTNYQAINYFNSGKNYCSYPFEFIYGINGNTIPHNSVSPESPLFTQDIGHLFYDSENNLKFATIAYENSLGRLSYSIELISDLDNNFCYSTNNILIAEEVDKPIPVNDLDYQLAIYNTPNLDFPFYNAQSAFISIEECPTLSGNRSITSFQNIQEPIHSFIIENPCNGILLIKTNFQKNSTLKIKNPIGKIVFTSEILNEVNELDIKHLSNGVYMLEHHVENKVIFTKFIIQK